MALRFFSVPLGILGLFLASQASARTWQIAPDGSGDAPTIQAGIDSAAVGDTVELACGAFFEHGIVLKSGVVIRSESGTPDCTEIDGGASGTVFFGYDVEETARLVGLTIRNGNGTGSEQLDDGGGVYLEAASLAIATCVFTENDAHEGGGIYASKGSSVDMTDCEFVANTATAGGGVFGDSSYFEIARCGFSQNHAFNSGALAAQKSTVRLTDCLISDNTSPSLSGVSILGESNGVFLRCAWLRNEGLALQCGFESTVNAEECLWANNGRGVQVSFYSTLALRHCTVSESQQGGVEYSLGSSVIPGTIEGSVIAHNGGAGIVLMGASLLELICCDIYGNDGGDWTGGIADQYGVNGNFSADPIFCDPDNDGFTLGSDSPCLPGNHPDGADCGLIGALGEGCEGPTSTEPTSWGGVKTLFR